MGAVSSLVDGIDSGHSMRFAPLAQLVERRLYTAEATGSSLDVIQVC